MTLFMYSKKLFSQCNLTPRIEPGQDNCFIMVPSVLITSNSLYTVKHYICTILYNLHYNCLK